MKKYRRKTKKSEPVWTKFEIFKCTVYGFILVILILIIGNQELFVHHVSKILFKMHLLDKIYSPKTEKDPRLQEKCFIILIPKILKFIFKFSVWNFSRVPQNFDFSLKYIDLKICRVLKKLRLKNLLELKRF